jgi:hypothetical protein
MGPLNQNHHWLKILLAASAVAFVANPALAKNKNPDGLSKSDLKQLKSEYKQQSTPGEQPPKVHVSPDQKFEDKVRELMEASDSEWAVLQPKIEKVVTLQRQVKESRNTSILTSSSVTAAKPGKSKTPEPQTQHDAALSAELQDRIRALRDTWTDKTASPQEVKVRLDRVRETKLQIMDDLFEAQSELRDLVTVRQEVVLVMLGVLD